MTRGRRLPYDHAAHTPHRENAMPAKFTLRAALVGLVLFWLLIVGMASAAPAAPAGPPAPSAAASTATITLNPIADSTVVLSSTSNFGGANDVHVDYDHNSQIYSRALIQF